MIDAAVYADGEPYDEAVSVHEADANLDVHIADPSARDDGLSGESDVIEAELYVDAEHLDAANLDVELSFADRSTGDESDASAST